MGYVLRPERRLRREVRLVAADRLDGALEQLERVIGSNPESVDLEQVVHDVRKRCKASRGLARLVEPALGDDFRTFDRSVRAAANQLSTLRDTHAVLATFDVLLSEHPDDGVLREMRERHGAVTLDARRGAGADIDVRLDTARTLLADALAMSNRWKLPQGFDTLESGVVITYRRGRSWLRRVRSHPTDHRVHEWRKSVKYLWYQMQLLHDAAPSVLGPLVDELDELAELLGGDHDLTVLTDLLDAGALGHHSDDQVVHVRSLARRRQSRLRDRAIRSGATIYAEPSRAFANRVARYWQLTAELGPEPADAEPDGSTAPGAASLIERERKFLIDEPPSHALDADAVHLRQGYLARDGERSIRVRDAGRAGCTLTFKAGSGDERTELEWSIERREFDAAWPHTAGHRVEKTRRRIPYGDHVIELDVFGGDLDGLVLAEVEFESTETMNAFEPPSWFGHEVTDDHRYTNVELALTGIPDTGTRGTRGV